MENVFYVGHWIKEIISHPNTPAYIQSIAVIIGIYAGLNYLKKRKAERKFDLIVRTYKCCLEAFDVLRGLKQAPPLFMDRDSVEAYERLSKKNFANIVSNYAEFYLNSLDHKHDLFNNLYNCYSEMRLFYSNNKDIIKPIKDLLWAKDRINVLLNNLKGSKQLMRSLVPGKQEEVVKIIRDGMVQIWENIELTDWQKEYEKKGQEVDGIKGVRKFYYLNNLIDKARNDIDEIFPKLIDSKVLNR